MTFVGPGHGAERNRSLEGDQAPAVSHRERQQVGVGELTARQVVVHVCRIEERDERVLITASSSRRVTQARANLSEPAEQMQAGAEKIITRNGESYIAAERTEHEIAAFVTLQTCTAERQTLRRLARTALRSP